MRSNDEDKISTRVCSIIAHYLTLCRFMQFSGFKDRVKSPQPLSIIDDSDEQPTHHMNFR